MRQDQRMRDVRMTRADELAELSQGDAPARRCRVCDGKLPKGLERSHCLAHSIYAQMVIQKEKRRRAHEVRARVA